MMYIQLFISYLKIGLFAFGGGYAVLSMIQDEAVHTHHWVTTKEFTDIVAISQMTPEPISINSATYIGYVVTGNVFGSLLATFALCLPSLIIMAIVIRLFMKHRNNRYVDAAFKGIRPAVVGLIAAAALLLMNNENFIDYKSLLICLGTFGIVRFAKVGPIPAIILAGILGYAFY